MAEADSPQLVVLETQSQEEVSTCSLVLSAVGISHTITAIDTVFQILVAADDRERAEQQLLSYQRENVDWPPPQHFVEQNSSSIQPPTLLLISALILFYTVTGPWSEHSLWFTKGAGNADAIIAQGEYYRLVTALTLHADITHLLGNCFLGGFIIHFFCRSIGSGLGIFSILLSATIGNYINVVLHGGNHHFVGFSTAVFSTIGMLVMVSYHSNRKLTSYQLFAPLMAGIGLLAMTGSSGERTDLGAHFFGLISGLLIGSALISKLFIKLRSSAALQFFLFLLASVIVYLCWEQAMITVY